MMVAVARRALVHQSLNAALQEFKADGKISEDTQKKCAQLISQVESELIGSANARAAP